MQYLKISNKSNGPFDRRYLEMLGFTTKRDAKPGTIGQFGSGTKLAAAAALRLGLDVAITSTDHAGTYFLQYELAEVEINGIKEQEIFLHYKPTPTQPKAVRVQSKWGKDAFRDWDKPLGHDTNPAFRSVREYLSNARDGNACKVAYVDRPEPAPPGETAVYLLNKPDVYSILWTDINGVRTLTVHKYFKFFANVPPLLFAVSTIGEIHPKSEDDMTRLFVQGVLVACDRSKEMKSLFDYSLFSSTLVSHSRFGHRSEITKASRVPSNVENASSTSIERSGNARATSAAFHSASSADSVMAWITATMPSSPIRST